MYVLSRLSRAGAPGGRSRFTATANRVVDFVHVQDVVQANLLAMQSALAGCHVFNVGAGASVSLKGLLDLVWDVAGRKADVSYAPPRPKDIRHSRADIGLAGAMLGYRPRTALREGLRSLMAERHDVVSPAAGKT